MTCQPLSGVEKSYMCGIVVRDSIPLTFRLLSKVDAGVLVGKILRLRRIFAIRRWKKILKLVQMRYF